MNVRIHPTFALLFFWVIYQWGITSGAGIRGIVFGSAILIAIFGCVLAHELAHCVVAIRNGLRVRDITLLPIGGVARIEHASVPPRTETIIALAGPAMNILIALLLTPAVLLIAIANNLDNAFGVLLYAEKISVGGFILYIWIANVVLAIFNLLPAFPMDGGRVLRAQISTKRDRQSATRLAITIGRIFAIGLALVGVVSGDYLLLIVSLFVLITAQIEARHVNIESALKNLEVGQFALWESGGIDPASSLAKATYDGPRDQVVTRNGKVIGMLWRNELLKHLNGSHHDLTVRDIMDRQFHNVDSYDSVYDVHLWLMESNRSAVAVVENGSYRGIFTGDRLLHVYETVGEREWPWKFNLLIGYASRLKIG